MSFDRAYASTMEIEGGAANNPKDPGGQTWRGISRVKNQQWPGWELYDSLCHQGRDPATSVKLDGLVRDFYADAFWAGIGCDRLDKISEIVAEELFEASVNCGQDNGIKFLQRALNTISEGRLYPILAVDGKIGSGTVAAVRKACEVRGERVLMRCQNGEQYIHYKAWSRHGDFPGVFKRV